MSFEEYLDKKWYFGKISLHMLQNKFILVEFEAKPHKESSRGISRYSPLEFILKWGEWSGPG